MKYQRSLIFLICTLVMIYLLGCVGGGNCPIDPPDCCTNSLFGCGTFDLPEGCSCSDYIGL